LDSNKPNRKLSVQTEVVEKEKKKFVRCGKGGKEMTWGKKVSFLNTLEKDGMKQKRKEVNNNHE